MKFSNNGVLSLLCTEAIRSFFNDSHIQYLDLFTVIAYFIKQYVMILYLNCRAKNEACQNGTWVVPHTSTTGRRLLKGSVDF